MDERQCLFLDVCSNWGCHEQVMSDWAEATTMSMLGPVTCSALTVSAPVSASASETPTAFAFKATASPLNVAALCAKLAAGLDTRSAARAVAISDNLFLFILASP